ncbi:MAG: PaaI family thioesterase [Chloroflexota bacterium]
MNRKHIVSAFDAHTIFETIGATLLEIDEGAVDIGLDFQPNICQQDGFVHAGIVTTIVDSACGLAALTLMPEGARVLTVEFKVNFMSPAVGDRFVAKGRVIKAGRTLTTTQGEVFAYREADGETIEKHIALMQATMYCLIS